MVQGAIKLTITTDARQTERQLAQLEQQVKAVKDLERENAQLSKSHAQAATSAQKAAKSVDDAFSKLQAARAKQEQYAAGLREQFNFGGNLSAQGFASPEEAAGKALSADKQYQQMSAEVSRLVAELERLREAQATAEVSEAELGDKVADTTQKLAEEREKLSSYQETHKKTASALDNTGRKLAEVSHKSKKAAAGLLSVKRQTAPLTKSILKLSSMFKLMLLRMVMRKVIESVKRGFENLAQYSSAFNAAMSKLSTSSMYLSNALATIFKPILEALAPVIEGIADKLVAVSNAVAAFSASLFGNATTYTKAKKAAVDYAKSATGVAKKNDKVVASFDEINKLSSNDNDGMPSPEEMFDEEAIDETVTSMTDKIKDMLSGWIEAVQPTIEAFNRLTASLEPLKTFAAQGLADFYKNFLLPVGKWALGEGLPRLLDVTSSLAQRINWSNLNGSLDRLWKAVQPLAKKVGEGLLWFYENVISPLVEWAMNMLVPHALNLVSAALEALDPVIEALKPWALWLWEQFLQPLGQWTGGVIINAIQWLTDRLREFAAWARENPEAIQNIANIILAFLGGVLAYHSVHKIGSVVASISKAFTAFGTAMMSPAGQIALLAFGISLLAAGIANLSTQWGVLSMGERVLIVFSSALLAAAAAWAAFHISATMGAAAFTIVGALALLGLTGLFSAGKQQTKSSQAPNSTFSTASMPKLAGVPRFATGAVVPPRNEFLAVMGDNKREREFVAPESAMKQSFLDALSESGLMGRGVPAGRAGGDIVLQIDGRTFARITNPLLAEENRRVGTKLTQGV